MNLGSLEQIGNWNMINCVHFKLFLVNFEVRGIILIENLEKFSYKHETHESGTKSRFTFNCSIWNQYSSFFFSFVTNLSARSSLAVHSKIKFGPIFNSFQLTMKQPSTNSNTDESTKKEKGKVSTISTDFSLTICFLHSSTFKMIKLFNSTRHSL